MARQESMEQLARREISATTRWGVALILTILVQAAALFSWANAIDARSIQNEEDITELEERVKAIDTDIRDILIGIQEIKTSLGIINSGR